MNGQQAIRPIPHHSISLRYWQHWTPYAVVVWSLIYATLGVYWAVSGHGFPYDPGIIFDMTTGPIVGRFGPGMAWIIVIAAGLPAAIIGVVMLRGVKRFRLLLITAGALLGIILLLAMIEFSLLIELAYIPYIVYNFFIGSEFGRTFVEGMLQSRWTMAHQLLCLIGGFLWLATTVVYARRSGDACLYCGRRDGPLGWNSPKRAARWGRIAVYVAMIPPLFYTITRYAWALGIPWGMSIEHLRAGQVKHTWTSGLFLATFSLVGALLMLGLVQRWGEVFPRWMIGLSGRRVPIALAVIPASIVSVLLMASGPAMWSVYAGMADAAGASRLDVGIIVGPVLLFPVWAGALAVATLGYYYRRRGACSVCGRGTPYNSGEMKAFKNASDEHQPVPR